MDLSRWFISQELASLVTLPIMHGFIAVLFLFGLSSFLANAETNQRLQERSVRDWIFGKKTTSKLMHECVEEIRLPKWACGTYYDGPHGCDTFCAQRVAFGDVRDCALEKAKNANASLDEAEFNASFDVEEEKFFNVDNECGKIELPEPRKTILQATQVAYSECMKQSSPVFGKLFFQFFTLPKLCANEDPSQTKTGDWLIRCLRVNTLVWVNGKGAAEQIAEVQKRFAKEKQSTIIRNTCKAFNEFKQLSKEDMKAWFMAKVDQLKQMMKAGKWNVIAGKEIKPSKEQEEKAEAAAEMITAQTKTKRSLSELSHAFYVEFVEDNDTTFSQFMVRLVVFVAASVGMYELLLIPVAAMTVVAAPLVPYYFMFALMVMIGTLAVASDVGDALAEAMDR